MLHYPFATLQTVDELGAPVVAAGSLGVDYRAFVSDAAQRLPSIGIGTEPNYEAIAAGHPDVIIGLALKARSKLTENPLWQQLQAVEADRAHEIDAELWFSGANVEAAMRLLDDIE